MYQVSPTSPQWPLRECSQTQKEDPRSQSKRQQSQSKQQQPQKEQKYPQTKYPQSPSKQQQQQLQGKHKLSQTQQKRHPVPFPPIFKPPILKPPYTDPEVTIRIVNDSLLDQQFMLYAHVPIFNFTIPDSLFTCAYAATNKVAFQTHGTMILSPSSPSPFNITKDEDALMPIYAVTGCANKTIDVGSRLYVSDARLLSKDGTSSYTMEMEPGYEPRFVGFAKSPEETRFQIKIDSSFSYPNQNVPFVGLGVPDPYHPGEIICVVAWLAVPATSYLFQPRNLWRCSRGSTRPGTVIDPAGCVSSADIGIYVSGKTHRLECRNDGTLVSLPDQGRDKGRGA